MVSTSVTPDIRKRLQPIVDLRQKIGRIDSEINGLRDQRRSLDQRAKELRANLKAIAKDARASALRKRLNDRLDTFTRDADKIGRQVVELQSRRLELKINLEEMLQDIDFRAPSSKPSTNRGATSSSAKEGTPSPVRR